MLNASASRGTIGEPKMNVGALGCQRPAATKPTLAVAPVTSIAPRSRSMQYQEAPPPRSSAK